MVKEERMLQSKPLICGAILGTMGSLGFYCMVGAMFSGPKQHPYFFPFCVSCGLLALIACFAILVCCFYRFSAVKNKVPVLLGAFLASILFFCLCLPAWEWAIEGGRELLRSYFQ